MAQKEGAKASGQNRKETRAEPLFPSDAMLQVARDSYAQSVARSRHPPPPRSQHQNLSPPPSAPHRHRLEARPRRQHRAAPSRASWTRPSTLNGPQRVR